MYRYYSTQRPVGPGTFPNPAVNKAVNIWNFDKPVFCGQIGREAWGCVEYEHPLDDDVIKRYELMASGVKRFLVEVTSVHTLEVEAENEDKAIEKACEITWEYDADEISGKILEEVN